MQWNITSAVFTCTYYIYNWCYTTKSLLFYHWYASWIMYCKSYNEFDLRHNASLLLYDKFAHTFQYIIPRSIWWHLCYAYTDRCLIGPINILLSNRAGYIAWSIGYITSRDQSRYSPSQWEMSLHCNDISHWLDPYLDWSLNIYRLFSLNIQEVKHQTFGESISYFLFLFSYICIKKLSHPITKDLNCLKTHFIVWQNLLKNNRK